MGPEELDAAARAQYEAQMAAYRHYHGLVMAPAGVTTAVWTLTATDITFLRVQRIDPEVEG